jgi:dolichol-phosphate mannosyltransferase
VHWRSAIELLIRNDMPDMLASTQEKVDPSQSARLVDVTIVAPTFNERDNVPELISRLERVLPPRRWELVFVDDDSLDGTVDVLRNTAQTDSRIRILHRIGRRGLSSAVVEGILSTTSPFIVVMDADLQHDEAVLPAMLERLRQGDVDVVVGSRYLDGGGTGDWSQRRVAISRLSSRIARLATGVELSDPMSGFFAIRREAFDRVVRKLSPQGFKILLDVVASGRGSLRVAEVPFTFRTRQHGESKLDTAVAWEYLTLLLDKTVGQLVPARFVMFMLVGGLGVAVHMSVLGAATQLFHAAFVTGQTAATIVAMTFNFFVNNQLTYRDRRLRGWKLLSGLLSFYAVCSIGAVANVGIANFMFGEQYSWWLSGISGVLVGAVWNYAASSVFTWRR